MLHCSAGRIYAFKDTALPVLSVHHRTTYRYTEPVVFNPHRLMLRPRESRELRLRSHSVSTSPKASLSWAQDVFGNTIATALFSAASDTLVIDSVAELELLSDPWPVFPIAASAITYPFRYSDAEWTDLGVLAVQQHPDLSGRLGQWARSFVAGPTTDTLSLLKDLGSGVSSLIRYVERQAEGTQTPTETLERVTGSCRDFALLFGEAARSLGFGARMVSGYLSSPDAIGSSASGTTHAWAEVYLPGAGWIAFDPTNRSTGGSNLIPVAVGRDISQLAPVSGSFAGPAEALISLHVEVQVQAR